jgi:GH15 family glucan-1,4-alpha-glucosidase
VGQVTDYMPVSCDLPDGDENCLVRHVHVVRGGVKFRVECIPAFDYGRDSHETRLTAHGACFDSSKLSLGLSAQLPLQREGTGVASELRLREGESTVLVLRGIAPGAECPAAVDEEHADELFRQTVTFWRGWVSQCTYRGRWREQVHRSALVLKLLTYRPTGAIVAAPTTSLPEDPGGERNWDYRFTWIRDAAFTLYGLLRVGFTTEAAHFMQWLEARCHELNPDGSLQIMYGIDGRHTLTEETLDHLTGYRNSRPVRVGNGAYDQLQLDIYGALLDSVYLYNKYGTPISYDLWTNGAYDQLQLDIYGALLDSVYLYNKYGTPISYDLWTELRRMVDWVCENWKRQDEGIWEVRGGRRHFVYSKLMCWVALDRGLRLADKRSFPADRIRWEKIRDEIYEEIMDRGWNAARGAFVQSYGSEALDAANLMMPLVFFLSPTDPRMLSTLDAILRPPSRGGLVEDSLVFRYDPNRTDDGIEGDEGSFNMCSFWLVEAMTRAGHVDRRRLDAARLVFEQMLGYANHVGLYAEETGPSGEALGNFPQAFTHLALISAAYNLDRALGGNG